MKHFVLKDVYEAYTNSDLTEGRGHTVHIGYFTRETDALRAVRRKGVMGTDANVRKLSTLELKVYEHLAEYEAEVVLDLRKKALAKLTAAERTLLGLPDV